MHFSLNSRHYVSCLHCVQKKPPCGYTKWNEKGEVFRGTHVCINTWCLFQDARATFDMIKIFSNFNSLSRSSWFLIFTDLCVHDPGHWSQTWLEADQVQAETNQHHGRVGGGTVLCHKHSETCHQNYNFVSLAFSSQDVRLQTYLWLCFCFWLKLVTYRCDQWLYYRI